MNTPAHPNSFGARDTLRVGNRSYTYFRLDALAAKGYDLATLAVFVQGSAREPAAVRRRPSVTAADVEALAGWKPGSTEDKEIAYRPARVLLQDFTGVPCVVDLAAMRDAIADDGWEAGQDQPAAAGRDRHRSFGASRRFGTAEALREQREARVRTQRRTLRVPEVGPERAGRLPRRPARYRDRPSGQHRVSGAHRLRRGRRRRRPSRPKRRRWPIRIRWSAPTRTRRWPTASACSRGASAASKPKPRCSVSRSRC